MQEKYIDITAWLKNEQKAKKELKSIERIEYQLASSEGGQNE